MESLECPEEVVKRARVLYYNSFSGFQGPHEGGKNQFIVCFLAEVDEVELNAIHHESGCETLKQDDFIGHNYLSVHWREYSKIVTLLNTLLRRGHAFTTQTKSKVYFDPSEGDKVFSFEALEEKAIKQVRDLLGMDMVKMIDDAYCEEWNYLTQEGKAFSRSLRANPLMWRYDTDRTNFHAWDLFKNYRPETLLSVDTSDGVS